MAADFFDVYDEYPEVVPVSVEEAARMFREQIISTQKAYRLGCGEASTMDSRMALREQERRNVRIAELRLFRSCMAAGDQPCQV